MWRNSSAEAYCSDSDSISNDSSSLSHNRTYVDIPFERLSLTDNMEQIQAQLEQLTHLVQTLAVSHEQQSQKTLESNNQQASSSVAQSANLSANLDAFYKIPDPIKAVPVYDGNKKQLFAWLKTAENALNIFKGNVHPAVYTVYEDAIGNKIQGRAKDALCLEGNPTDFQDIKEILVKTFINRYDLSTHMCQLWHNKMNNKTHLKGYYMQTKELIQKIKQIARQNEKYCDNWSAINHFIDETSLAAFIAGLQEPYFGYVQAARPEDLEGAYAFLCKLKSNESTAQNLNARKGVLAVKHYSSHNDDLEKRFDGNINKPRITNQASASSFINRNTRNVYSSSTSSPVPMETESSKSKLTVNRKDLNTTETFYTNGPRSFENEEEDILVNFWEAVETASPT